MNVLQTVAHFVGAILIANFISEEWDYRYLWRVRCAVPWLISCVAVKFASGAAKNTSMSTILLLVTQRPCRTTSTTAGCLKLLPFRRVAAPFAFSPSSLLALFFPHIA